MFRRTNIAVSVRAAASVCLVLFTGRMRGAEYRAESAADVTNLAGRLQPGDTVILANGDWVDQTLVCSGIGNPQKPITYRAETPGRVVFSGASSIRIEGQHVSLSGIVLTNCTGGEDGIQFDGANCRLTDSAVVGGQYKFFIHFFGVSNRMDHCYIVGKTTDSPTLEVEVGSVPNYHRIDHNHFGPRPPLRRNGGETMRIGYSWQSQSNSCTTVEQNLFENCDGELEIVSNKSGRNIYRGNTFLTCAGTLTLRHGNSCLVDGNFFLGQHKRGTGGIRVIDANHTIINNYFEGVESSAFSLTAGMIDPMLTEYFQVTNCLIAFNTVVDCRGPLVNLDAGYRAPRRVLRPQQVTIANNIFAAQPGSRLIAGKEGADFKWLGNITTGEADQTRGFRVLDPGLERAGDGLWRPAATSPARAAAVGNFPQITTDMDGQPRTGKFDVGCDQISNARILSRPLTEADVGPAWKHAPKPSTKS